MIDCPKCHARNLNNAIECVECGFALDKNNLQSHQTEVKEEADLNNNKLTNSVYKEGSSMQTLGALIAWMLISQLLGLYSVGAPIIYFIETANPFLCTYPLLIIGLAIASWVFFTKEEYKKTIIITGVNFVLALFFLFMFWGSRFGG